MILASYRLCPDGQRQASGIQRSGRTGCTRDSVRCRSTSRVRLRARVARSARLGKTVSRGSPHAAGDEHASSEHARRQHGRIAMTMPTIAPSSAMTDQPTPGRILELGLAFWGSKALLSAVELGVFSVLAQGPLDVEALRKRLGVHPRSARDFFDALVALGMLERTEGRYTNTPES